MKDFLKRFWLKLILIIAVIGPGIIAANADNDAGGITTYSIAGAHFGTKMLWILFLRFLWLLLKKWACVLVWLLDRVWVE